ncbi:MAG: hypothetical protein Q8K00_00640 [Syntrophales bacterium]|nr:hypothetical protein [Syntrophales bacterium]
MTDAGEEELEDDRNKRTIELNAGGKVDGYMIMPGQDDLHYWKAGWLQPLG